MRSPTALFMGDALTSLSNDDYTLFYNPAALTKNKGLQIYPINFSIGVSNILSKLDTLRSISLETASNIAGIPIHLSTGATPTIKMGPFGLSFFYNRNTNFIVRNKNHPNISIKDRVDRGVILGYAHKVKFSGSSLSIGLGIKAINREIIDDTYMLYGTKFLTAFQDAQASGSLYSSLTKSLGFTKGKAIGGDIGLLYEQDFSSNSKLSLGFSAMNLFNTYYKSAASDPSLKPSWMHLNFGASFGQKFGFLSYDLSMDIKPINFDIEFTRKLQLGLKIGFKAFDVFAGINSGYLSYGASLNIYGMRLIAGLYSVETGINFRQEKSNRALIYLSILDFSFEAGSILE